MSIYSIFKKLLFWAVLLVFVSSCNAKLPPAARVVEIEKRVFIKNAPDWVNNGSSYISAKNERSIHGVGYSLTVGDLAKQKALADDIARVEVERLLIAFLSAVSKNFPVSVQPKVSGAQSIDNNAVEVARQIQIITSLITPGTRIIKSWRDPENNAVWSLALLDIKRVRNIADGQNEVDKNFLRFLEAEADNIFDNFITQKQ